MGNGDKPYAPDRVGNVLSPAEVRRRMGFDQQMDPAYGVKIDLSLTDAQKKLLAPEEQRVFIDITSENSLEGIQKQDDPVLGEITVSAHRWDGLSLKLPTVLGATIGVIQDLVDEIIAFLNIVKVLLEVILTFLIDLGDLVKKLVEKVLAKIADVLGLLSGKTGLYWINIPPILPLNNASKERLALIADLGALPPDEPAPITQSGNEGFITVLQNSLDDEADLNRPQFGSTAWMAGIILMYGGTDLSSILDIIKALKLLFKDLFKDAEVLAPPAPAGFKATVMGAERVAYGMVPKVKVSWEEQLGLFVTSYPRWYAFEENVYVYPSKNFLMDSEKTDTSLLEQLGYFGAGTNPDDVLNPRKVYSRELEGSSPFGKVTMIDRRTATTTFDESDIGRDYIFRVSRSFYRETSFGVFEKKGGKDAVTEVFSSPAQITLGTDAGSTGIPPNWKKFSMLDLLPALGELMDEFEVFLENILASFGDLLAQYKEYVQMILAEVNKWILFGARLSAILSSLKAVLEPKAGVHALSFFGKGGNDYMMQVLRDSIARAPKEPETPIEDSATLKEKASAHKKAVVDSFADLDVTEWNYADASNRVPSFGSEDIVGGGVILAGDESLEAVKSLSQILMLLFGDSEDDQTALSKAASAAGPEMVRLTPEFTLNMRVGTLLIDPETETIFDAAMNPVTDQADKAETCG